MPWTEQLLDDFDQLKRFYATKLEGMPDAKLQPQAWVALVTKYPNEWKELVTGYCEFEDPALERVTAQLSHHHKYSCTLCPCRPVFKSAKALASHMRAKHKIRSPINKYIDSSGKCPVCGMKFSNRERVLAHVSERRIRNRAGRPNCRQKLLAGAFPILCPDALERATLETRVALRESRKRGHTHVIASTYARKNRPINVDHTAESHILLRPWKRLRTKTPAANVIFVPCEDSSKRRRLEGHMPPTD
eukprot:12431002-Karenia_brevis.AAC.1